MPRPRTYATTAERMRAYRVRQAEQIAARTAERTATGIPAAPAISSIPATPRWNGLIGQARLLLEQAQSEMQEYHDERSAKWQERDKGEEFAERLDHLQEAIDALDSAVF